MAKAYARVAVTSVERLERLRHGAAEMLPRLLVAVPDRVTLVLLDAPGGPPANGENAPQRRAVTSYDGQVMVTHETSCLAWMPDPALAIGAWLLLGDEVGGSLGGGAEGFVHTHDLLHASIEEAGALAALAGPDQLMLPFDVSSIVDLRDPRFGVESPDRGALVPWSCRLIRRRATSVEVRELGPADAAACDAIIAGLPDWFGLEQGIRDCSAAVRSERGLVAADAGEVTGFLTWVGQGMSAEITWMAVRAERRGNGIGRALIDALATRLRAQGVRELAVKTLSSRHPDPGYAQTRAFYLAMGFIAVRELDVWGPDNPAVLLTRPA